VKANLRCLEQNDCKVVDGDGDERDKNEMADE
jgi:hypothetical protein